MVNLITQYRGCNSSYILVSDEIPGTVPISEWRVEYNANSDTPFEVFKADYKNEIYNHYGDYRTLDKVMRIINGVLENNTVSKLLPIAQGTTVILQFGKDVSFDTTKFADEKVDQIHFDSPTETTFIMSKQSIPIKGEIE